MVETHSDIFALASRPLKGEMVILKFCIAYGGAAQFLIFENFLKFSQKTVAIANSIENDEEQCERLPPKYSNSSGSLQYARFDLLSLLKHGTDLVDQIKYVDKAMLILGNTGSGKTTITQILSGNLDSLHAVLTQSDRLVIIDDNFKISGPSTTSKTLIPELVVVEEDDEDGNNSTEPRMFYDCPGFDDTRGPEQDLAANFFMNHVVRRKVNQIKMLFLVIHSSVKLGNDRLDFDLLATHATKFVKDLSKYRNSIGLVVTKVNSYNARGRYIPDKTILREIVEFLEYYTDSLQGKLNTPQLSQEERALIENKIKFVEILLEKNKRGDVFKISFSRDPEKCGPLSESMAVAQTRTRVQAMYENQLEFTVANFSDFGYTLKDSTTLSIRRVSQNINREIAASIDKLTTHFDKWMETEKCTGPSSRSLDKMVKIFESAHSEFTKLKESMESLNTNSSIDVVEITKLFSRALRKVGYHVSYRFEQFMERQQTYIEFFEADDSSKIWETWMEAVEKLKTDYANAESWLKFCQDVERKVALYSFQDRKKIAAPGNSSSSWLSFLEVVGNMTVSAKLKEFSRSLDHATKPYLGNVLLDIMMFAMKNSQVECKGTTAYISGHFVLISEFSDSLNQNTLCGTYVDIKRVEIYASNTIFVDDDLLAVGRGLNVVLITPNLMVIGQRHFNLRGDDAGPVTPAKASSGRHGFGEDGTPGVPGKPGGPGGSIFGVIGRVTRENEHDWLNVNCDGGDGGRAQAGGDGGKGPNGRLTADGSHYEQITDLNILVYEARRKEFSGYAGHSGGNGGMGGFGGLPGQPGKYAFEVIGDKNLDNVSDIVRGSFKPGKLGEHGIPGLGGLGGSPGYGKRCKEKRVLFWWWNNCENTHAREGHGLNGVTMYGEYNSENLQLQKPPEYTILKWQSLANFKNNFYDIPNAQNGTSSSFMNSLDKNSRIMGDITNQMQYFLEEFQFLGQYATAHSSPLKLYARFIAKFEGFVRNGQSNPQASQVANLLLAAAYSKVVSLKQGSGLGTVLDIQSYLTNVDQQLQRYTGSNALEMLMEVQRRMEMNLENKATNVKEWAKGVAMSAVANVMNDNYHQMNILEQRLVELLTNTEDAGNWGDIQWQMSRSKDIQETLQLYQTVQLYPLAVNILSFLADTDLVDILTSTELNSGSALIKEVGDIVTNTNIWLESRKRVELTPTIYLGNKTMSSLNEKFSNDSVTLNRLKEVLDQAEILTRDAYEKRNGAEQSFVPLVKSIMDYFSRLRATLKRTVGQLQENVIQNGAQQLQVQKYVKCVKESLKRAADGVTGPAYLNAFDRIQDGFTLLSDLYDNIEQHQNLRKLTSYLHLSANDAASKSGSMILAVGKLQEEIERNVLEREYQRAWHAVKQWAFPLAKYYEESSSKLSKPVTQVDYLKQVRKMKEEVGNDGRFQSGDFYNEPFYVWKGNRWSTEIKELLAGQRVHLKTDFGNSSRDAVRCHKVKLNFKVKEDIDGRELIKMLNGLKVVMTHSGISYYKWGSSSYVMTGKNVTLEYVIGKDEGNEDYRKLSNAELRLSPYTLWTVQLQKIGNENDTFTSSHQSQELVEEDDDTFEILQRWAKWVELELVGTGVYVEEMEEDLEVDNYYESIGGSPQDELEFGEQVTMERIEERESVDEEESVAQQNADEGLLDEQPLSV